MEIVVKENATYKEIKSALNNCRHGEKVVVEYNTVRNFNLNDEVDNLSNSIKSMSINDVYEGSTLNSMIRAFFDNNIHGEYKNEIYYVRKVNNHVEYNDADFILFNDHEGKIKSVYSRNIISIEIDGVKYTR